MAIAITLQQYLVDHGVTYDTLAHPQTPSASRTAQASHVPGDRLAKAVMLRKGSEYVLAVVPASRRLRMSALRRWLKEPVGLATEEEFCDLFPDCDIGAIPALGDAYGLATLVDKSLEEQPDVYFEAGDHRTLIHVTGEQFRSLMENAPQGRFSVRD